MLNIDQVANSIYNNRVSAKLSGIQTLTPSQKTELLTSALAIKNLSGLQKVAVLDAYSEGTKAVFISITVLAGVNLICACFLKVSQQAIFRQLLCPLSSPPSLLRVFCLVGSTIPERQCRVGSSEEEIPGQSFG